MRVIKFGLLILLIGFLLACNVQRTPIRKDISWPVNVRQYGASGDGINDDDAINNAINAMSSGDLYFPKGTYRICSNIKIPSSIRIIFENGAKLSVDSGVIVVISGTIGAGLYQIFSGNGSISLNGAIREVYPQWWGAKGDDSKIDTGAIQAAVTSLSPNGGVVYFPRGLYIVSDTITVSEGVYLQGASVDTRSKIIATQGSSIRPKTNKVSPVIRFRRSENRNVHFGGMRNLRIYGLEKSDVGVEFYRVHHFSIMECEIRKFDTLLKIDSCYIAQIQGCRF
jgi:hypothetical protein